MNQINFIFFVSALFASAESGSEFYPASPPPDVYIVDKAGVVDEEYERLINELCREVEFHTSAEMAVLTIPTIQGGAIVSYATDIRNRWGVGQKNRDKGLVMVVVIDDRQVFTAAGSGMERILPYAEVNEIYRRVLVPDFKKGRYQEGIYKGLQAYARRIGEYYHADIEGTKGAPHVQVEKGKPVKFKASCFPALAFIVVLVILGVVVLSFFIKGPRGKNNSKRYWYFHTTGSGFWGSQRGMGRNVD